MEFDDLPVQNIPVTAWLGPISHFVGWIGNAAPFLLRRYYTEKKLSALLLIEISSSGEGACYCFSSQEGRCWIQVTNLSPFDFTIERMRVTVSMDGGSFVCSLVLPKSIKAGSRDTLHVKDKCHVPDNAAAMMKSSKKAHLEIEFVAKSPIRSFGERRYISDMRNLEVI